MKNTPYQRLLGLSLLLPAFSIAQSRMDLNNLEAFKNPAGNWSIIGNAHADLTKRNKLITSPGTGILLTTAGKKATDLYTQEEFGDIDLELNYMMAAGGNSGIYLQSRYEFQLSDNWGDNQVSQQGNGGIYPRWNDSAPEGQQGYEGHAPRTNVTKAPGTWQHLKISFRAPRFDAKGNKTANAKIISAELNGVIIHENIELTGPTRGSVDSKEVAKAPLRIQGDHGTVAFKNIVITNGNKQTAKTDNNNQEAPDPILINASSVTIHRSFMDIPKAGRLTHSISVGTPQKINFTYDPLTGFIAQAWRGEFLDATPMWHDRGDGSSRPRGAVQYFGKSAPAIAKLADQNAAWPTDTANTGFKPKGYKLDNNDMPTFVYSTLNMNVSDAIIVADKSQGITRQINIDNVQPGVFILLASSSDIEKISDQQYLIGDKSFYLNIDKTNGTPIIRNGANGSKELIIPAKNRIVYTILF